MLFTKIGASATFSELIVYLAKIHLWLSEFLNDVTHVGGGGFILL